MDTLLTALIGFGYVVGPLSLGAMVFVGWKLITHQRHDRP
jgi:hypothetical protein